VLALDDGTAQASWLSGAVPLAAAAVDREFREAMAAGFDAAGC